MTEKNTLHIDLGFIRHDKDDDKAARLQALFTGYSVEPNEYGFYLKFENYSYLCCNHGVMVHTNCFESEEHFHEQLVTKLLFNI